MIAGSSSPSTGAAHRRSFWSAASGDELALGDQRLRID